MATARRRQAKQFTMEKVHRAVSSAPAPTLSASTTSPKKVHTTALCWIPQPGDVHDAIQSVRRKHDRQIKRWPPHVNLLYPFVPEEEFEGAARALARALKDVRAFDVNLSDIRHFEHSPNKSYTAWLHPEETEEFKALQFACLAAYPHCNDQSEGGSFVPHLSVGQCKSRAAVDALITEAGWKAAKLSCGEVCLISRAGKDDPFEVKWRVQLGEGTFTAEKSSKAAEASATDSSVGSTPFNDALHQYSLFPRPKTEEDLKELAGLVSTLAGLCGTSTDHWKVFILVAFQRRYHARAPAATAARSTGNADGGEGIEASAKKDDFSEGDGERLIFYVTCLTLRRSLLALRDVGAGCLFEDEQTAFAGRVEAAVRCAIEAAVHIGGTRDLNALTSYFCLDALANAEILTDADSADGDGPQKLEGGSAVFKSKLLSALGQFLSSDCLDSDSPLEAVLAKVAALLDDDLAKCAGDGQQTSVERAASRDDLMSTVHVTLPHRDRGNRDGSAWRRNLSNAVAELLIWRRTTAARKEERFSRALEDLIGSPTHAGSKRGLSDSDGAYDCVLRMQTTARKKRRVLNEAARSVGHLLCSRYLLDRTSLSFWQIRRGKAGDISRLKALASKFGDKRVLTMIAKRNADPDKASPAESVSALISGWKDTSAHVEEGSIDELEMQIQEQTVRATVDRLRSKMSMLPANQEEDQRTVLVTQQGRSMKDAVCAILVAAALSLQGSRLLLGAKECDVSTEEEVLRLLNAAIQGEIDYPAEARSVEDILKNEDFHDIIFLSATDIELDEETLREMQRHGRTIRVHATSRVERVGAPPVVELKESIKTRLKSGAPLSVSVLLDCTGSMSCEIDGCKKGALRTIELFHDLAPVRWANFMGYWDPIGSRGDPAPRSCGYLDPRSKGSLDAIQKFVDSQLPCTGGGDEPEDVPAALEKLLGDMKAAGLSADEGVHFVFFIADAGYRPKENARVTGLLQELAALGTVMVMCPVRGGGTCRTLVAKNREVFHPGQYIELGGVSQLDSIAAAVTESVRASLFQQGNVASVTASVGETMEAMAQLCSFQRDHKELERVEELAELPEEEEEAMEEGEGSASEEEEEAEEEEAMEEDENEGKDVSEEGTAEVADKIGSSPLAPVFAPAKKFGLTNIDRIYLSISRLPMVCHKVVEDAFGGRSLQEIAATDVAGRLVEEGIAVESLRKAGYPAATVELVRKMMGGHGVKRVEVN